MPTTWTVISSGTPVTPLALGTVDTINEFTVGAGVTVDGVLLKDSQVNTDQINEKTATAGVTLDGLLLKDGAIPNLVGLPVQTVISRSSAFASGTTTIPYDDTVPQNTEGTEFITATITPKKTTNRLIVDAVVHASITTIAALLTIAIFKDSDASALAAGTTYNGEGTVIFPLRASFEMAAGTVSPITFKVRGGANVAATFAVNGDTARKYGGVLYSELRITEVIA